MNIIKWLTSKKYRVFSKKVSQVTVSIWEYEFKINKSRQLREQIRQDRDRAIDSVNAIEARLKDEKDSKVKEGLIEQQKAHAENAKRFEKQMVMIDNQINGVPAEGDNPGEEGIMDTIKSLAELKKMYIDYISKM